MIVIGSVNIDLSVQVAQLPKPGETVIGHHALTGLGGKGANQAVAAARLGAEVVFMTSIGQDRFADLALEMLAQEPLQLQLIPSGSPSGLALIGVAANGENSIIVASGANNDLLPEHVEQASLEDARWVLLQFEIPKSTWQSALKKAKELGAKTLVNASPLQGIALSDLENVDVLVVNEHEAQTLLSVAVDCPELARCAAQALTQWFSHVVITLGSQGVVWATPSDSGYLAAHRIHPVDTTGAGDAFCGALCAALDSGLGFAEALAWGNAAGALTASRAGTTSALPNRAELGAFLAQLDALESQP